jgi:hypothetical protein
MADSPSTHTVESSAEQSASRSTASPAGSAATDHLQRLRKMSTTAGLGSGDYAAISPAAIAALVIGLLGILAFLTEWLLALPVIAIICGIIALRAIHRSNGTQTGTPLAWAGLVFGLGVLGVVGGGRLLTEMRNRPAKEQVVSLINQLDQACAKRDYHAAYQLFDPVFRKRVDEERFIRTFAGGEMLDRYGAVEHVNWNQQILFFDAAEGAPRSAAVGGMFKFEHYPEFVQQPIEFVEIDGKWMIRDMNSIFPRPQQGPPPRQ